MTLLLSRTDIGLECLYDSDRLSENSIYVCDTGIQGDRVVCCDEDHAIEGLEEGRVPSRDTLPISTCSCDIPESCGIGLLTSNEKTLITSSYVVFGAHLCCANVSLKCVREHTPRTFCNPKLENPILTHSSLMRSICVCPLLAAALCWAIAALLLRTCSVVVMAGTSLLKLDRKAGTAAIWKKINA